jgi:hypothetical protein
VQSRDEFQMLSEPYISPSLASQFVTPARINPCLSVVLLATLSAAQAIERSAGERLVNDESTGIWQEAVAGYPIWISVHGSGVRFQFFQVRDLLPVGHLSHAG